MDYRVLGALLAKAGYLSVISGDGFVNDKPLCKWQHSKLPGVATELERVVATILRAKW